MSDTPRTDAEIFECHDEGRKVVDPEFAKQLERELTQAHSDIKALLERLAAYG